MRLKRSVAAVSVAGLMALAACGGGSDGGGGSGDEPNTNTGAQGEAGKGQDPDAEAPAPAIDGAAEGGTVNVLSALGEQTLDPTEAYFVSSTSVLTGLVTRSLTQFVYRDGEMVLIPDLATDLGTPNDDYTEWTFTLREGIKWEDGSDVTPEDWVFGIERSFDNYAEGSFPNGATYSKEYFLNGETYNGPYSDPDGSCECVTVEGDKLTIKMARPFPDMPYWGMFPAMGPIPADQKTKDPADYALHPWALGPYKFVGKINVGRSFKLERNENWDPETDPGRTAYPDAWDFKLDYGDPAVMERLLLNDSGVGRTGLTPDNVTAPNMAAARDTGRLVTGSNPCTYFYYMDMRKPMWQDINVRKAFALSLPVQEGWLARGSTPGVTRIPATTILPPGTPGRKEFDALGTGGDTPDPEQARQLLEEADAVGTKFKFSYSTEDPLRVDEKNAMVKGWKEAGFDPQPVAVSTTTDNTAMQQDPNSGLEVNSLGWCSDWPSGSSWFPPVFSSDGSSNYSYLRDKELDARMDEIQTLPIEDQPAAWGDMDEQVLTEIVPVALYGYGGVAMLHGSAVQGMNNDNVLGQPTFKDIWLQQ